MAISYTFEYRIAVDLDCAVDDVDRASVVEAVSTTALKATCQALRENLSDVTVDFDTLGP